MRRILLLLYWAAYFLGIIKLFYYLNRKRQLVLAYHNVIPDECYDGSLHLGVSCRQSSFEAQMEIIRSRFTVTTEIGGPGTCMITFDDGYRNNYLVAAKILHDLDMKAVFFVPACLASDSSALWDDRMLMWLSYVPPGQYLIAGHTINTSDDRSRRGSWALLWRKLQSDYATRDAILTDMAGSYDFASIRLDSRLVDLRFTLLTMQEVGALKEDNNLVACHSHRHDILSRLSDCELEADFAHCERQIGVIYNARLYSYPFGGSEEVTCREIGRCERSQFERAFLNVDRTSGPYGIGRLMLPDSNNRFVIHAKLSGFEAFLKRMLS